MGTGPAIAVAEFAKNSDGRDMRTEFLVNPAT